jgi:hypothetical protein
MSRFTIISSVYNEYELLRQFIESIITNVDPNTYDQVIIVDDYSKRKGILREYENYVNKAYDKINIILHDEYRHAAFYQSDWMSSKTISQNFDYRLFESSLSNNGVMKSYQMALEYVNTDFVIVLDTDCVFLSKFGNTFDRISTLYDENQDVMSISQLVGHSSNDIFTSNKIGTLNMPGENGGAGGPSPMCSTFRIAAWTKYDLCPLQSRPGRRVANGFIDFFMSVVANGYKVMNFPFYSQDYIYHVGGGTTKRNVGNTDTAIKSPYGSAKDITKYAGRNAIEETYDYYAGAHYVDMTSPEFKNYLEKKYKVPFDKINKFDESILRKLRLAKNKELVFREPSLPVKIGLEELKGPRNNISNNIELYKIADTYQYGTKKFERKLIND